jgi:arylsulfatase A-like enzyme
MPSLHGVRHNGIPLSLNATTFVDLLRAAGYDTALIGKCHLQSINGNIPTMGMPERQEGYREPPKDMAEADKSWPRHGRYDQELPATWENEPDFEPSLPYYGFRHLDLAIGHADRVVGHYARWLRDRYRDPDSLRGPQNQLAGNNYAAPQSWRTRMPEELYPTTFVAEKTIAYLENHARSATGAPFFIQCSFPDPHHPFTPPGKYWDMYHPADVSLPASFHSEENALPPHLVELYKEREAGKSNRNGQRVFAINEREAREAIALTYGMITMVDDAVGRIIARLRELGLTENTMVVFTTDHGDFMGDHQLLLKGALHYQGLVRVPFIWVDPSVEKEASVCSDLCGTLDVARTILDRAGLTGHNGMQGRSLLPAVAGHALDEDSILIEEHQRRAYMGFDSNFRARTLMTDDLRLTVYSGAGRGELYDLRNDPAEVQNLWNDSNCQGTRHELMERLVRKMMDLSERSPVATHHGP